MADTKISALTAVTTPAATDEFAVNQGGTSKKVTLSTLTTGYLRSPVLVVASSTASTAVKNNADYVCDGTADNVEIQSAITAIGTSGGTIQLTAGTFNLAAPVTIANTLMLVGSGWKTILSLNSSVNDYAIKFDPSGGAITGTTIADLSIDGNAASQSSGGCIYAAGAVQCIFDNLHLYGAYDNALYLYQISGGNPGHHNRVTRCLFDTMNSVASANQRGILIQSSDENVVAFCDFENWGGSSGTPGSEPYAIKDWAGLNQIISNVFVGGQEAIRLQDISSTRIIGNTFDGVGRSGIHASGSKNVIMGNLFSDGGSSSSGAYPQVEIDNSTSATVVGNSFTVTSSGVVRNCVREFPSCSNTIVVDNIIDLTGGTLFNSNPAIDVPGTYSFARNNAGWNYSTGVPYDTGTTTLGSPYITTGDYLLQYKQFQLSSTRRATLAGTSDLVITDWTKTSRLVLEGVG